MANVKSKDILKPNEIYMMFCRTGYHDYYSFGVVHEELFKQIVKMYNGYCSVRYNSKTFRKLCNDDGYYVSICKVPINSPFCFNDDCCDISQNKMVTDLGEYFDFIKRNTK